MEFLWILHERMIHEIISRTYSLWLNHRWCTQTEERISSILFLDQETTRSGRRVLFHWATRPSRWRDSNSRPSAYKADAITTMLHRHILYIYEQVLFTRKKKVKQNKKIYSNMMQPVGFEPTPPKRLRPERSALDHSAKTAWWLFHVFIS